MPVDFKTNVDLGTDVAASIQPVADGEPVNSAILVRPSENLRVRTEELKRSTIESELIEVQEKNVYTSSKGEMCKLSNVDWADPDVDGGGDAKAGYAIPVVAAAYQFKPIVNTTPIIVASPSIPGSKTVTHRAMFDAYTSESTTWGDDSIAGFGGIEHALVKRGDTLALIFPQKSVLTGVGPSDRDTRNWYPDDDSAGGYAQLVAGNVLTENNIIKLPQRVILKDTTVGLDLATRFGPNAVGPDPELFLAADANGFAAVNIALGKPGVNGVWINITKLTGGNGLGWHAKGGRGGRRAVPGKNNAADFLRVAGVTANTVEVYSTNPFRIIWPEGQVDIEWNLYTRSANAWVTGANSPGHAAYQFTALPGQADFTNGYTEAKDFSNHAVVPLVTHTGEGFDFGASGYLPKVPGRIGEVVGGATEGFTLPIDYGTELARQGSVGAAYIDEGALLIGCKPRTSPALVMGASSLSVQLDAITAAVGGLAQAQFFVGTYGLTTDPLVKHDDLNVAAATLVVPLEGAFPVVGGGKAIRFLGAWIDLVQLFSITDLAVQFGHPNTADAFLPSIQIGSTFGVIGKYETAGDLGAYNSGLLSGLIPRLTFTSPGGTLLNTLNAGELRVVVSYSYY